MKVTPKAEALIKDVAALLWENGMTVSVHPHRIFPGLVRFGIRTSGTALGVKPHQAWSKTAIKESISVLYKEVAFHDTLFWLRKLKSDVEDAARLEHFKTSLITEKKSEKLEAYRSRVMVKAVKYNLDYSDIFVEIAKATTEDGILRAENWVDAHKDQGLAFAGYQNLPSEKLLVG